MYIRNKTKTYTPGCTKEYICVPDQDTDDYRLGLARQWLPRIYQEMVDYNSVGGRVVFATFTYRPESLPNFIYYDSDTEKCHIIPGFSAVHKNDYLQSIRNYLDRNYGLRGPTKGKICNVNKWHKQIKYMSMSFRYMWSCEYGLVDEYIDRLGKKRKGCHQPHYHCLFFIPPEMVRLPEFKTESKAKKFFASFWKHGFTMWSKPALENGKTLGIYCTSEFACEYVSKYCFKDVSFYSQPEVQDFLYETGKLSKYRLDLLKDYLPRHWQSMSFGVNLKDIYDDENEMLEGHDFHFLKDFEKGRSVKTKCPQYIKRKLYYDQMPDGRYVINEKGVRTFCNIFPKKYKKLVEKLKDELSPAGIAAKLREEKLKEITGHNVDSFYKYILDLMDGRTFNDLALYSLVWQGLFLYKPKDKYYLDEFKYIDSLSLEDFERVSLEQYSQNLLAHENAVFYCSDGFFNDLDVIKSLEVNNLVPSYYMNCKRFANFDIILELRNKLRKYYMQGVHDRYLDDRKRRKEVKFQFA